MKHLTLVISFLLALSATAQNRPYITRIYDFCPAPGQFVNELPEWYDGDSKADVLARVAESICGFEKNGRSVVSDGGISLGAFGGYVVFGFDHPVVNIAGEYDFQIFGNSFQADSTATAGGSSEPGIVHVSEDVNGNGEPDDPWYELAASEFNNPAVQRNYTVTYYRPDANHTPVPQPPFITDSQHIFWTSNDVNPDSTQGYIAQLSFHNKHSYWPGWLDENTLTFSGAKLPNTAIDESGNGSYWVQRFYDWGYVDNRLDYDYGTGFNNKPLQAGMNLGFKIEWAVDSDGRPANLRKVDFIKVYNAVQQQCGWLGETSTEVMGAIDIHPDATLPEPQPLAGDVNSDNKVDIADLNIVLNLVLNSSFETPADLNNDGKIDVSDINQIINILLTQ